MHILRKRDRPAFLQEERQAVTFFGRETGRHIFRKKDKTRHSPEEGKDDKKIVSREEAAVRKKILTGLLCLAIPLLLAACSASNAAESRETAEEKAGTEEVKEETEEVKEETEEVKAEQRPKLQMLPDPPLHLPQSSQTFLRQKKALQMNRHNRRR